MAVTLDGARFPDIPSPPASLDAPAPSVPAGREGPSAFERLAHGLGRAIDQGEELVGKAALGRFERMDAATLIAIQAGIYRYSEAIDLATKLVDRTTSAARTVLEAGR
ncbi:MAG TPA: hypothetical protein VFV94_14955 [Polyangiaceae bacterium]|nr:hypothetical protein [Polyangiaceae bacterium]